MTKKQTDNYMYIQVMEKSLWKARDIVQRFGND